MDDALLTLLRSVDTPTVCNAIETAEGKRGFNAFTRGTVMASAPDHRAMVGFARTARISALAPSPDPAWIGASLSSRGLMLHMPATGSQRYSSSSRPSRPGRRCPSQCAVSCSASRAVQSIVTMPMTVGRNPD